MSAGQRPVWGSHLVRDQRLWRLLLRRGAVLRGQVPGEPQLPLVAKTKISLSEPPRVLTACSPAAKVGGEEEVRWVQDLRPHHVHGAAGEGLENLEGLSMGQMISQSSLSHVFLRRSTSGASRPSGNRVLDPSERSEVNSSQRSGQKRSFLS